MNLLYSKIVQNKQNKKATFFLFGAIGSDVNGDTFANELRFIAETQQINDLTILINSPGGNVFQGYSIIATVEYLQAKGVNIKLKNVGIAYSMAGVLLASGKKGNRTAVNYATTMIHDARFAGENKNISDAENSLVQKVGESLALIISEGSGQNIDKVKESMGKETTFTAEEAKEFGIVDEVELTGKQINQELSTDKKLVACAALYNSNININKKDKKMKLLNEFLGLNAEASEAAALSALRELKEDSAVKDEMVNELQDKLKLSDAKVEAMKKENGEIKKVTVKANAETLINTAVTDGKIQKDGAEKWIENAIKDFEGTKDLLESLSATPGDINAKLKTGGKPTGKKSEIEAKAAKFEEMLSDPAKLDALSATEKTELENAFNEINKTAEVSILN